MSTERQHVLVIDANPQTRRRVRHAVSRQPVHVSEVRCACAAASAITTLKPRLVFVAARMQCCDAVDAVRVLGTLDDAASRSIQLFGENPDALQLLCDVGRQRGLRMLPPLRTPIADSAIRKMVAEQTRQPGGGPALKPTGGDRDPFPSIDLGEALDRGWLEVWYQPTFKLHPLTLAGAEALIRARHPTFGLVPPAAFLPQAKHKDLMRLTDFVLRHAVREAHQASWFTRSLEMAANVPADVLQEMPLGILIRELRKIDPSPRLVLEITEDQALANMARAQEAAAQLRIWGVALSIDDFGTGYSGLARLRELPFSEIKLDRSLVSGCAASPSQLGLCQAVIELAHGLGARVIAEGIETTSDLQALKRLGCDMGQGYLLGRPAPDLPSISPPRRIGSGRSSRSSDLAPASIHP